jgi:hypothetical protein
VAAPARTLIIYDLIPWGSALGDIDGEALGSGAVAVGMAMPTTPEWTAASAPCAHTRTPASSILCAEGGLCGIPNPTSFPPGVQEARLDKDRLPRQPRRQ